MDRTGIDSLLAAVTVSPDNLPLRRHVAIALIRAGLPDEAEQHVHAALAFAPSEQEIALALGELLRGRSAEALAYLVGEQPPVTPDPDLVVNAGVAIPRDELLPTARDRITLDDVAGMDEAKKEFRLRIVAPFTHPELHAVYGRVSGGGVLLYGPPGCGKTLLARAAAGEVGAEFISVGIEEVLDMWIGASERNLHDRFEEARRRTPCVLFFDEVDALGPRRGDIQVSSGRSMVNQFLAELDGVSSSNDGVLVMAASNAPWHLDAAFRRPGRFDRVIFVPPPDLAARQRILALSLRDRPTSDVDLTGLAGRTSGLSGADLVAVVDRAAQARFAQALETGRIEPITNRDLAAASADVTSSAEEWFRTARNWARYSNESGQWDDVLRHLDRQ